LKNTFRNRRFSFGEGEKEVLEAPGRITSIQAAPATDTGKLRRKKDKFHHYPSL